MNCECENAFCNHCHGERCPDRRGRTVTIYGTKLCDKCARNLPDRYKRVIPAGCGYKAVPA